MKEEGEGSLTSRDSGATPQSKVTAEVLPVAPLLRSQTGGRGYHIYGVQAR